MSHLRQISEKKPVRAAEWQDLLCELNDMLATVLAIKGANIPLVTYVEEKCAPVDPPQQ